MAVVQRLHNILNLQIFIQIHVRQINDGVVLKHQHHGPQHIRLVCRKDKRLLAGVQLHADAGHKKINRTA